MIVDFDDIMTEVVSGMTPITINGISLPINYYWGRSVDLAQFLKVKGAKHVPLIWSVSKADIETEHEGLWSREVEVNFCHIETNDQLLNTTRLEDGYSYKRVLFPLWEAFARAVKLSGTAEIKEGTARFTKFPNYIVSDEFEVDAIWDVLRVEFTCEFSAEYNC